MTDPLPQLERIVQLTRELERLHEKHSEAVKAKYRYKDRATALIEELITEGLTSKTEAIFRSHQIEARPRKEYSFRFQVTGQVTRSGYGTDPDDAWENLDLSYIDPTEVDNIALDVMEQYETVAVVGTEPLKLDAFFEGDR